MFFTTVILIQLFLVTACQPKEPTPYVNATPLVQKSRVVQIDNTEKNFELLYGNDPALESAFKQYTRTGKAPNVITDGFVRFAYNPGQMPIIKTVPFQETVISLEPGERFTNISSGDPSRWSYAMAVSGSGARQQQNILVKPTAPDLSTNMVVTTDKRIYNLRLLSGSEQSLPSRSVSFWYPDEMVAAVNSQIKNEDKAESDLVSHVDLSKVDFRYRIESKGFNSHYSWQPTRVFDDGTHTYIQFPQSIQSSDMPALFISTKDGNGQELVNYRSKPPYFVVDRVFDNAVLVKGVGRQAQTVSISHVP
ncbi:MAG: P-type conjugative transfer protein TrbG [Gammaproteobacteria bacterium]|nr:P-type conjugative transfer protein TrbG [Gammaproteobacteria bacterium]